MLAATDDHWTNRSIHSSGVAKWCILILSLIFLCYLAYLSSSYAAVSQPFWLQELSLIPWKRLLEVLLPPRFLCVHNRMFADFIFEDQFGWILNSWLTCSLNILNKLLHWFLEWSIDVESLTTIWFSFSYKILVLFVWLHKGFLRFFSKIQ